MHDEPTLDGLRAVLEQAPPVPEGGADRRAWEAAVLTSWVPTLPATLVQAAKDGRIYGRVYTAGPCGCVYGHATGLVEDDLPHLASRLVGRSMGISSYDTTPLEHLIYAVDRETPGECDDLDMLVEIFTPLIKTGDADATE